jgi:hypothetical protein
MIGIQCDQAGVGELGEVGEQIALQSGRLDMVLGPG